VALVTHTFLRERRDEIVAAWEAAGIRERRDVNLPAAALRDDVALLLDELAAWLEGGEAPGARRMRAAAARRAAGRLSEAHQLTQLVHGITLLRSTTLRLLLPAEAAEQAAAGASGREERVVELARLNAGFDHAIEEAVEHFVAAQARRLEGAERATRDGQAELRASEERFRALVTATSDVLYRMSPDWKEMRQLLSTDFIAGTHEPTRDWQEKYIHPEDWPRVKAAIDEAIRTKRTFQLEHRLIRADGSLGWTVSRAIPVLDARGAVVEWFGAASDVTDRKRAEAELRRAAELLELGDAFWELDPGWRVVRANPNSERLLRRPRSEVLGRVHWDLFPSPPESSSWRELHRCIGERVPVQFDEYYPQLDLWANVTAYPVLTGGIVVFFRDIHAQKRAELALRASEARYRTLFESMAEGFQLSEMIFDEQGTGCDLRYLEVNRAFERHTGLRAADVVGKTARALFPGAEPEWFERLGRVASTGEPAHFEGAFGPLRKWFELSAYRTEPDRVAVVFFDATERKQALEALREADRRKDEFLGILSHELRNPLAPIRNSVFILERAAPGTEAATRAKEVIRRQTAHLTRLVDDLLDVTRVARGKIELRRSRVDLREVVLHAAEDFRLLFRDRGVALDVVVPAEGIWADADATRITQVIGNLLHNASKFTRGGESVALTLAANGAAAEVRVRDTGAGIDPALLPTIFEAFVQGERTLARTEGGLGLGLALVKGIVELHGGSVRVESGGKGRGAEFVVRLPLAAATTEARVVAPRPLQNGARRVLVVDDNADAAETLAEIARMLGHDVDVANDGASALDKARANPPDVVLCDIGLPGMSGYDVARALRASRGAGMQLIAVTGYAQPEDVRRAVEAGFDAHLAKPANLDVLMKLLAGAR
jgi:PAS domain S-box-containing protein